MTYDSNTRADIDQIHPGRLVYLIARETDKEVSARSKGNQLHYVGPEWKISNRLTLGHDDTSPDLPFTRETMQH